MDVTQTFELLRSAEAGIEQAQSNRYLGSYALDAGSKNIALLKSPGAKHICDRLVALQYLNAVEVSNLLPEVQATLANGDIHPWVVRFDTVIRHLQEEAGLKQDAWLASKTFDALQQVYTFEDPPGIETWGKLSYQRFYNRAIYCRLNVLGLVPQPIQRFFEGSSSGGATVIDAHAELAATVNQCLQYFKATVGFLKLSFQTEQAERSHLIPLLFNTDLLTRLLSDRAASISQKLRQVIRPLRWKKPSHGLPKLTNQKLPGLSLRFLMSLARVETWLNGYGSEVIAGQKVSVFKPGNDISARSYSRHLPPGSMLPHSANGIQIAPELMRMINFWENADRLLSQRTDQSRKFSKAKTQRDIFQQKIRFAGLALRTLKYANALNSLEVSAQATDPVQINQQLNQLSTEELASPVWQEDHSASLFDGVKRAMKWLWHKVTNIFQYFLDKLRLLARAVKSLALKGFEWFKKLGNVFYQASQHITKKTWYQSETLLVLRDLDFDLLVCSTVNTGITEITTATDFLIRRTGHFRSACALVFLLFKAATQVKNILINPVWGGVKALLLLFNLENLLSDEDKAWLSQSFDNLAAA